MYFKVHLCLILQGYIRDALFRITSFYNYQTIMWTENINIPT